MSRANGWQDLDIDQSHEIVELGRIYQLNGKSWRVVQIDPGPTHYGYRVAGTGLREAAIRISDKRTLMDDGFWVSQREMRYIDAALSSEASVIPLRVVVWLEEA